MTALEPFLFADLLGPVVWLGLLFLASLLHRHLYRRPEPVLARLAIDGKTAARHFRPEKWRCSRVQPQRAVAQSRNHPLAAVAQRGNLPV